MTQKLFSLCLAAAVFAFVTANIVSAEETKSAEKTTVVTTETHSGCPCSANTAPRCFDPCHPPVVYRVGLFGVVRPVVYAPVYRPYYYRSWYPAYAPCPPYAW